MSKKRHENGFLFWEASILGLLLVAMTAFLALPRHAASIVRMEGGRTTAIFLAEQELTELALRARDGSLADGSYGWLGPADDLRDRQTTYEITGTAQKDGARGYALTVRIVWQEGGASKEVHFERWVAQHDAS
ncbi:hypothetical protein [uncultured Selenomonas sp.]|uniref:hypothetical protein n=1 Tax=uncultured Selenomonas sp. TaxID=159275 RepID=UPI0025EDB066|nr:hypothetical protein [uncultured Selenomonas sp.]